ncbi:hypothetical protein EHQ68_13805 [Leptospira congkakensis]|uniref:Glycosyltransferase RgtA/B/C/D-like domain-containing protein n=1 Tax=Leptospira congkakensis TaxID=2484932 RepID=A0A4Z1ADZ7_9LEPT|nr:hypothetical protein [Leptospira congkakensis]TGL86392.1 hypothetical protein EHQ68_13805 [Leptospira congkakensis]TGL94062.1 hypothetical protein EHQ69_06225 [Leptospira congkakensis]TGL94532.1 hypothetical protein EHQ70_14570 [Leptospira congkakensis]
MKLAVAKNKDKFLAFVIVIISAFIFKWIPEKLFVSTFDAKVFNSGFYTLSLNPITSNTPWDQFFTPWFLWATGLVSKPEDIVSILDFVNIVSGLIIISFITYRFHWSFGLGLALLIVSSPLYLIFKTWIGFSDPITFLLISLYNIIVLSKISFQRKWILLTVILFLGLSNHCFQFLVLVLISGMILFLEDQSRWRLLVFSFLTSGILYSFLLIYLFIFTSIHWNLTRVSIFSNMIGNEFIRMNVSEPILGTIGLFHGLWPFVLYLMYKKPISIFVFIFCYIISMLTYDTNRVFAILSTPVLILYSINFWNCSKFRERYFLISLGALAPVISVLYPLFYKWDGRIIYLQ